MRANIPNESGTIASHIRNAAAGRESEVAVRSTDCTLSYGALVDRMDRVTAWSSREIGVSGRVLLIAGNCPEYFELVAGLSQVGLSVVTLNPQLSKDEICAIIDDSEPAAALIEPRLASAWEAARVSDLATFPAKGPDYEGMIGAVATQQSQPGPKGEDCFAICYTSGTTGKPKGVMLSHRSRVLTIYAMAEAYGCYGSDDNFLALAPFCHGAGFAFAAAPLFVGGTVTLGHQLRGVEILERMGQGDITGVFIVPTHAKRFCTDMEESRRALSGHKLTSLISNAAAMPQALKVALINLFGEGLYHETYGSTEAGIVTNIRPPDQLRKTQSVGLPFPGNIIELRDYEGNVLEGEATGELFSHSPYSFIGYLNREEETRATMYDGWITVGDIAMRDDEGFYHIVDRKSDMIVSGGMNVYPREIEAVAEKDARLIEAAAVGVPDKEWGEAIFLFYVAAGNRDISGDLAELFSTHLAGYKRPKKLIRIEELPRNPGGKILRRSLRDLAI